MNRKLAWVTGVLVFAGVGVLCWPTLMAAPVASAGDTVVQADGGGLANRPLVSFIRGRIKQWFSLRQKLGLSQQQRTEIHGIVTAHRDEIRPIPKDVAAKRKALREAVLGEPSDEQAIREAAKSLGDAIADAAVVASKVVGEVRPVLTTEQVETLKELRQQRDEAVGGFLDEMLPE